jgi:hypothetical protein
MASSRASYPPRCECSTHDASHESEHSPLQSRPHEPSTSNCRDVCGHARRHGLRRRGRGRRAGLGCRSPDAQHRAAHRSRGSSCHGGTDVTGASRHQRPGAAVPRSARRRTLAVVGHDGRSHRHERLGRDAPLSRAWHGGRPRDLRQRRRHVAGRDPAPGSRAGRTPGPTRLGNAPFAFDAKRGLAMERVGAGAGAASSVGCSGARRASRPTRRRASITAPRSPSIDSSSTCAR